MTAETASNDVEQSDPTANVTGIARTHLIAAAILLVLGAVVAAIAALQLVLPDLLSGVAATTYGRLAPAGGLLLEGGWLTLGLLGGSYWALGNITGAGVKRSPIAYASLVFITVGVLAGVVGILLGYQSGLPGLEAPVWARAISAFGFLLAAISLVGTARDNGDRLGAAGWYLTAAPLWLTLSAVIGLIPQFDGIPGNIQTSFATAGFTGLFYVTASVGLIYYVLYTITDTDPTETRPLSALGFWSLTLIWANLGAIPLIYTPVPDWYETISVAFAIASLIPLLTIAGDIGLLLRGRIGLIRDRTSLRLAVIASLSLAAATLVGLLWAWRATSTIVQYTTWVTGFDALIVLGGGSFAVFAATSEINGGNSRARSVHTLLSTLGLATIAVGWLVGGVIVGFSWAAGPASQTYTNAGVGWKVTADTSVPFLWIAAVGMAIFAVGQLTYLATLGRRSDDEVATPPGELQYNLDFEGTPRYATWSRLMWGTAAVWVFAALMTLVLPVADGADRQSTILADTQRTYASGSAELEGRNLYISEGCIECHTQVVRPIGTDVGLGTVSVAGDYANENPALVGTHRFGPDLMHYATRGEFFDKVLVQAALLDPRALASWSTMPSYSYLSSEELGALVSYLETLR